MSGRLLSVYCGSESFSEEIEDVSGDEMALRVHDAVAPVDPALASSLEFDVEAGGFSVAAGGLRALRRVFAIAVEAGLIDPSFPDEEIHRDEVSRVRVGSGAPAVELRCAQPVPDTSAEVDRQPHPPSNPQWAVWASGQDWDWNAQGLLTAALSWSDREATYETARSMEAHLSSQDPARARSVTVSPSWGDGEIGISARTRPDLLWAADALDIQLHAPSADDVLRFDLVARLHHALTERPTDARKLVGVALTLQRHEDDGIGVELALGSDRAPRGTTLLTARELERTFRPSGPRATVHPILTSSINGVPEDPAIAAWRSSIDTTPIRGLVAPPTDLVDRLWICVIWPALKECWQDSIRDLPAPHPVWVLWVDANGSAGWNQELIATYARDPNRIEKIHDMVNRGQHPDPLPQAHLFAY